MTEPDRIDKINEDDELLDKLIEGGKLPDDWDKL